MKKGLPPTSLGQSKTPSNSGKALKKLLTIALARYTFMRAIHIGQIAYCDFVCPRAISRIIPMSRSSSLLELELFAGAYGRFLGTSANGKAGDLDSQDCNLYRPFDVRHVSQRAKVRQDF
jgi:hypothetical protein